MKKLIYWIGMAAGLMACIHEVDDLQFGSLNPGVAFPIGQFTLKAATLTQVGDSLMIREDAQGVIEFFYDIELMDIAMTDRMSLPNQSFNESLPFSSFVFVAGQTNTVKASKFNSFRLINTDLADPPAEIHQLIFKSGKLVINQSKDFDHDLETTISFPTWKKNGNPISIVLSNNATHTDTLDLSVLGLTGVADTSFNTLDYEVSTIVRNTGVDASGTISISFSMVDMAFSYFKADLKTYDFDSLAENISLGLPQSEFPDNIGFSNPQFRINVTNSTGVTTGLRISEISVKMADSSTQIITGTFDDNPFITDPAPNPGEVVTSQFEINNQNTDNLISLLNNIPSSVLFKGLTTMNPNGTPASLNFITDSSKISMSAQLVIPMEGYANNYQLKDTVNANLNIGDNGFITLDEINLRLQVENAFPFGLGLQVYFLDSLDNTLILDSLFSSAESQQVFPAAQVDGTGLVTSPTIQVTNVTMAIEKYERVRNAGSMVIVASLSTPGANDIPRKSVKITTSNYFTIGMGLSAHALIDPNTPN